MSYCRKGEDSDVYVIASGSGWVCYCKPVFSTDYMVGLINHLRAHERRGERVPAKVYERLRAERLRDE